MAKIEHKLDSHEGNPLTHATEHLGKADWKLAEFKPGFQWYLKISFRPSGICFLHTDKVGAEPLVPFMMYALLIAKIPGELQSPISNSPT